MNDGNSLGAVRDSLTAAKGALTDTHMHTPLDTVVHRGRARRARRRAAAGAAALACLVVAGLVAGSFAAANAGRRAVAGSSIRHTTWRLVSEVSAAGSSWRALSPSGYEQTFSLKCPSESTCYAEAAGGPLEYTHDGGSTWQQATGTRSATSRMLPPPISCVNARDCDVLTDFTGRGSTFLTTTDGGQTWTSQHGPAVPNPSRNGLGNDVMSCATISSCVVLAYDGDVSGSLSKVFTTSDGGARWSQGSLPSPASGQFVPGGLSCTGTTCVALGTIVGPLSGSGIGVRPLAGAAYTSDDGGATWSASAAPPDTLLSASLTCPDATDCYATTLSPRARSRGVYQTKDGGQTWGQVSTSRLRDPSGPWSGWSFTSMSCASSSSCWLAGGANPANSRTSGSIGQPPGLLASTTDGGAIWAVSTPPAGVGWVTEVTCPDTATCFALGIKQTGPAPFHYKVVLLTNAS